MDRKDFVQRICDIVCKSLGSKYRIETKEVLKNNGVLRQGLMVKMNGVNVSPIIYLDKFWECYKDGMPVQKIADKIIKECRHAKKAGSADVSFFSCFEEVKEKICFYLINREANRELLEGMPYVDYFDLAICFFCDYRGSVLGDGRICIDNEHVKMWGTSTEELFQLAAVNTPRLYPWKCTNIEDILFGETGENACMEELDALHKTKSVMKVLTNQKELFGAACILYPEVLAMLAEKGNSYYFLPSSVHEWILVCSNEGEMEDLRTIVREVNQQQLDAEDVLSDNVYSYEIIFKQLMLLIDHFGVRYFTD